MERDGKAKFFGKMLLGGFTGLEQALPGLFDTDRLDTLVHLAPQPQAPQQPQMSIMDQMDERKGKFKNRLGLFSHLMLGGDASKYVDKLICSHSVMLPRYAGRINPEDGPSSAIPRGPE